MRACEFINLKELDQHLEEAINVLNPKTGDNTKDTEFRFFRDQYKKWDKSRYKELFQLISTSLGYDHDNNYYRLYLPFDANFQFKPNQEVIDFIKSMGFEIVDYPKGIIQKHDSKGKLVNNNIQSILTKYKKPELEKLFVKDQKESKSNTYQIVISRHAYDILGMSTGRDWSSCMKIGGHENYCKYLPMDIKEGTLVAYMIKSTDRNITKPVARLSIRPYINNQGDIAFGEANRVYHDGLDDNMTKKFEQILGNYLRQINELQGIEGIFYVKPVLYPEGNKKIRIGDTKTQQQLSQLLSEIGDDYSNLKNYPNLSDNVKEALIDHNPLAIQYLDNLTYIGDLNLSNSIIPSLPDNLTVNGSLDISESSIESFGDNLSVRGDLILFSTSIHALPDNLTVGGNLRLSDSNIQSLPDNLTVGRDLGLNYSLIQSIGDNTKVGEHLDLSETNIKSLPDNLTVGGNLYLHGAAIQSLTKKQRENIKGDVYPDTIKIIG